MLTDGFIIRKALAGAVIALFCLFTASAAWAMDGDKWQNEISIYGWYAGIDGVVQPPGGHMSSDISFEASDILDNLKMILMAGYEGKKGRWSVIADMVYMDVGGSAELTPFGGASVDLDMKSWILNGGVGYDLTQTDKGVISIVGGVRYFNVEVDTEVGLGGLQLSGFSGSEGLLDGIIGLRGFARLGENWFMPFHADIGAGGSELTYQLYGAVGYRFGWGDVRLGYRYLKYDLEDDMVMTDMALSGPIFGVGFRF